MQIMLELFREDVIGETLNTHISRCFDTCAATDRLSKKLLTSSSFMTAISTIVRHKTDTAIEEQNWVRAKASMSNSRKLAKHMEILLKNHQDNRTLESKKLTAGGPEDVDQKAAMQVVKTARLNNICTRWNR